MNVARILLVLVALVGGVAGGPYDGWKPHVYCNDVHLMDATRIQPLTAAQERTVASLEQVQIVARHGARAPYNRISCWENPQNNPINAEWNCTTSSVSSQDIGYKSTSGFGRLYGKLYLRGQNLLSGNCMIGGLLPEGRQQHLKNGGFLREAYIGEGSLKLFPTANLSEFPLSQVYLRSDDQERTLGSGQVLVDGFFPPDGSLSASTSRMLTWHVSDMDSDYVAPNAMICPALKVIEKKSTSSADFQRHLEDPSTIKLERAFQGYVGKFPWNSIIECLSIARCNNLPLPHGIDEELFAKVFHESEIREGMRLTYNNSWYAKTAMQPLMKDFINRLDASIAGEPDAPRLAITMGHDSTIMPLMASILREKYKYLWTPYAGMLVMELYKTKAGSHAVRLLFQGHPLQVPECDDTLCDIADFMKAVSFARTDRNCQAPRESSAKPSTAAQEPGIGFFQYLSAATLLSLTVICIFLGSRRIKRRQTEDGGVEKDVLIS